MADQNASYREWLVPPVMWWLLALGFATSFGVAVAAVAGWEAAVVAAALVMATCAAGFWAMSVRLVIDQTGVSAGRARISWEYLADLQDLDRAEMRELLGAGADPQAYLVIRPYIVTGLRLDIADSADPHPYWLLSCRHPKRAVTLARMHLAGTVRGASGSLEPRRNKDHS